MNAKSLAILDLLDRYGPQRTYRLDEFLDDDGWPRHWYTAPAWYHVRALERRGLVTPSGVDTSPGILAIRGGRPATIWDARHVFVGELLDVKRCQFCGADRRKAGGRCPRAGAA